MEEQIDTAAKFAAWCQRVKARRARNKTLEGKAHLTSLIVQARETVDELRALASDMEEAADGIGRGAWYCRKLAGYMDEADNLIDCVEEQLEREIEP